MLQDPGNMGQRVPWVPLPSLISWVLLLPPLSNQHGSAARSCRQPRGEAASDGEGRSSRAPFLCSVAWFSLLDLLLPPWAVGVGWRPRAALAVSAEALLLQRCP